MTNPESFHKIFPDHLSSEVKNYLWVFYLSFKYSQGDERLQRQFYNYFRKVHELKKPNIFQFLGHQMPVIPANHSFTTSEIANGYARAWRACHRGPDERVNLFSITYEMIVRDLIMMLKHKGRNSYFWKYCVKGKYTHHSLFEALFDDIHAVSVLPIQRLLLGKPTRNQDRINVRSRIL